MAGRKPLSEKQRQVLDYVGQMAGELQRLSRESGFAFLSYIFGMAAIEIGLCRRGKKPPRG